MILKKMENKFRAKEQLAEGLHLIDFEQLKIENQSLNEKIEERNEELLKLRRKNSTTVQVKPKTIIIRSFKVTPDFKPYKRKSSAYRFFK